MKKIQSIPSGEIRGLGGPTVEGQPVEEGSVYSLGETLDRIESESISRFSE